MRKVAFYNTLFVVIILGIFGTTCSSRKLSRNQALKQIVKNYSSSLVLVEGRIIEHFSVESRSVISDLETIKAKFRNDLSQNEPARQLTRLNQIGIIENPWENLKDHISVARVGIKKGLHRYRIDFEYSIRLTEKYRNSVDKTIDYSEALLSGLGSFPPPQRSYIEPFFSSFFREIKGANALYFRLSKIDIERISGIRMISDTEAIVEYELKEVPTPGLLQKALAEAKDIIVPQIIRSYDIPFVFIESNIPKHSQGKTLTAKFVLYDDGWRVIE